jgi:SynChlorMet cassette radical SAM/SPASM protein ScmF
MKEESNRNHKNRADARKFPLNQLYFYLTKGCNLACSHCWLSPKFDPNGSKYPVLPFGIFEKIIAEAKTLGLTGVKLTGGEPLLHPDFLKMLQIIKCNELNLTLESNGILLTQQIAEEISLLDNPFVSISLDGADSATHDKIRGVAGAFDKAISAIRNLTDSGIKPQVIMSLMHVNVDQVPAVIEIAENLGASSVKFNIIQPTGRGETICDGTDGLEVKKLIQLGRKLDIEMANDTSLQLYFDYPIAFRSLSHIANDDGCGVCGILSILGVLPSGEYALCGIGSHVRELVFGKAGEDSLADVWHKNPALDQLRSGLPDKLQGICSKCLMKHYCLGSCLAQNYYRTSSLWGPFWFCEQADNAGLFPDSRLNLSSK